MAMTSSRRLARWLLARSGIGARRLMQLEYGVTGPHGRPDAPWHCAVLKSAQEVEDSVRQVQRLGLPRVQRTEKNWDSLAALDLILRSTTPSARILDAGGERYSMILPWLCLYGYRHLTAANLAFRGRTRRGPIVYEPSDITKTTYPDAWFDAVVCQSVIEHGVDLHAYFKEMSRILKTGGVLITSTDYYDTVVDTRGQQAFGVPVHVFTRDEIVQALEIAAGHQLTLISPLDPSCTERVVHWEEYDLRYTFIIFSLEKVNAP
jgi:SAM-dependent methyltransferase